MLAPETVLQNRYRIVRIVGQGGMGAVYEAVDLGLGNTVALKQTIFNDEEMARAFEREARLLASLHHPSLPGVSNHFVEDGVHSLVMEFVPGDDLARLLKRMGQPFPLNQVIDWALQLLDVLEYLHNLRPPVIHRDIKPQNLKLDEHQQIVLLDFGLAKGEPKLFESASASSVFGFTINYAPLEQIEHTGTDARSDIYSAGATLYQLLTSKVPPGSLSRAAAIVRDEPDPLASIDSINPQVSPAIAEVVKKSMALKADDRYATAAEMRNAFKEFSCYPSSRRPVFGEIAVGPDAFAEADSTNSFNETIPVRSARQARTQLVVAPALNAALEPITTRVEFVMSEPDREAEMDAVRWDVHLKWISAGLVLVFVVAYLLLAVIGPPLKPTLTTPVSARSVPSAPSSGSRPTTSVPTPLSRTGLPPPQLIFDGPLRPKRENGSLTLHWKPDKGAIKYQIILGDSKLSHTWVAGETTALSLTVRNPQDAQTVMLAAIYPGGQTDTSGFWLIDR